MTDTPAFAAALEQNAALFVAMMLDEDAASPSAIRGLAELCRQVGALDEARQLYARLMELEPADPIARELVEILNGRPCSQPAAVGEAWPTPFVRLVDFLPVDVHAQVQAMTTEALSQFVASEVYDQGSGAVDPSQRVSSVLAQSKAFARLCLPYVESAVDRCDIAHMLGIERSKLQRYELQLTCHGDGAFFKAHTDSGKEINRHRTVSFVYYFHSEPRRFRGGGLSLFDASPQAERYAGYAFTRIDPANNSIVFFPSPAVHEVGLVTVDSGSMADARFTLNGWIYDDPRL